MKIAILTICLLLTAVPLLAQDAAPKPCVIFSAHDPATGIASWSMEGRGQKHMLTYLAGDFPEGMSFHAEVKDKEVDKIKRKGGRVIILDPHYTHDDLEKAKKNCSN